MITNKSKSFHLHFSYKLDNLNWHKMNLFHTKTVELLKMSEIERPTWIWFHPSSSLIGIVQINGLTLVDDW